jgi:AraC-like DNA-binding protein
MNRDTCAGGVVSDYREFPPPSPLAGHLLCLWTQTVTGTRDVFVHRVLPDACLDIVFINDEPPVVVGPWTEPFLARLAPDTMIVGARCHPGLAPSLLGLPASELLNQSVPLRAMWSATASAGFARINDQRNLPERFRAMVTALLERLTQPSPVDHAMCAAICWLANHPHGRIAQLSECIGCSSRQLQRRFTSAVGYGPKTFQSVLRFQRLLSLAARATASRSLAQFSVDAGYADQAHMTREVQRFSGSPPTVLLRSAQSTLSLSNLLRRTADRES